MSDSLNKKHVLCSYYSWTLLSGVSLMSASLSNKHVLYIYFLIMFIVAVVGWVLDVNHSGQQKFVPYMLIMFMDIAVGWVLDVSSEQEMCAMLSYFLQHVLATWLLFSNPPMKFKFIKVEDPADRWVPNVSLSKQ
jgi:hypothetical protein